jgi:Cu(I)/Ag(I) efflux system membrane protein CusA/SilA
MPELDEGDLMYMPTTLPGLSIGKAQELLQQTDRLIATLPEVEQRLRQDRAGRHRHRPGASDHDRDPDPAQAARSSGARHDTAKLIAELDRTVAFPGVTNAWVMPIKTRIDMLATGIKTPVGIKVAGPDLREIERIGREIEKVVMEGARHGVGLLGAGRRGRYIDIVPDRVGRPLRPQHRGHQPGGRGGGGRDQHHPDGGGPGALSGQPALPAGAARRPGKAAGAAPGHPYRCTDPTGAGGGHPRSSTDRPCSRARTRASTVGPSSISAMWIWAVMCPGPAGGARKGELPPGYSITWSGQYEYMLRARSVWPGGALTLLIIFVLLYLTFPHSAEAVMVMASLPFALVGGFWLIFPAGYNLSVAVGVGFIALAGVAAEFGVVMLVYLDNALKDRREQGG